jgi:hypothetical protein
MTVNRQLEACKANDSTRHEAVSLGIERRAGVRTFFPAAAEEFEVRRLQLEKAWLQILSGVLCRNLGGTWGLVRSGPQSPWKAGTPSCVTTPRANLRTVAPTIEGG